MVYMLLADGFEPAEVIVPLDILRRGKAEVKTVGVTGLSVAGSHGVRIEADVSLESVITEGMEMLIIPGGGNGVKNIKESPEALELVKCAYNNGRIIGAICAGPTVLAQLGMLNGRRAVCFPGCIPELEQQGAKIQYDCCVTHDKNIVTAVAAGSSFEFGFKLLAMLNGWGASEKVRKDIYFQEYEKSLT